MSSDLAISVVGLSKCYTIYSAPQDRLKQAIMPRLTRALAPFARAVGKELTPPVFFQHHWALREVSFDVERGETLGVIGRNGAGKSTLLQLICGTLSPTSGEVKVKGRAGALLELGSGFNPDFTGRENVYLNATILGLTGREIDAKLDDILAFADIGSFIDQPIKTYSSGMAMRLAFAVIAHVDAEILIIDEALAVGDAFFQQKCMRWLRRFRERGTILFCGHDTGAVVNLCNRAVWLDHGHVKMVGWSKDVCEAYAASAYSATIDPPERLGRAGRLHDLPPAEMPREAVRQGEIQSEDPAVPVAAEAAVFDLRDESSSFGSGLARICEVTLTALDGSPLTWIEGGEDVLLTVAAEARAEIGPIIVGFIIKDRLGQPLLGDNTMRRYAERPVVLEAGDALQARFAFQLPLLASGRYSVTVAVASGTLENHVQDHWLHDALMFYVHSGHTNGVMVALPMLEMSLTVVAVHSGA